MSPDPSADPSADHGSGDPPRWRTRSIETVYDNPWITVSHREVTAPTGVEGIYGLVHFKRFAIGVVPIDAEGYTWLVGQWRYTLDAWSWEIPEGGADEGEAALDAARRELREETGLVASRWTPLLEMRTSNSVTDEIAHAFVATGLTPGEVAPDPTEHLKRWRLPFAEALEMALDGRIDDSFSLAALMKAALLLDRGRLDIGGAGPADTGR